MGEYVDTGAVNTWYTEQGGGDPLVLLHGGLCTAETWGAQIPDLVEHFHLYVPERRGHGHTADVPGPLTYGDMATDTVGFLERVISQPAHLVGWSDGGIVGLLVAIERPDLVGKLVTIGTNFDTSGNLPEVDAMFAGMTSDGPEMAGFRGLYEMHSPDGPEHWPEVFAKWVEMIRREPHITPAELTRIAAPTLVVVGDDDMISLEHSAALYAAIPNAQLAVIPGASHAVPLEKPDLLNRMVIDFLRTDAAPTMLPIRRAATSGSH